MKCPKCGYNSFDHLESCKKCGEDMVAHQARFGLRSLFFCCGKSELPTPATSVEEAESKVPPEDEAPAAPTDFGFDFMCEEVPDEGPLESSLDELLGTGHASIPSPLEPYDDAPAGAASDFDFAWEEEPLAAGGEVSGDETDFAPEAFPGFAEDEPSGLFLDTSLETVEASPEPFAQDTGPASGLFQEELPEFVLDEEPVETRDRLPGIFGQDFALVEQTPWREDSGDSTGGAAEPSILSESVPAAESFSWGDASEGPSEDESSQHEYSKPNLAELFLESLDDTVDGADGVEATEAAPAFFADEGLFGNISSEVTLVEPQHQELQEGLEDARSEKSAAPDTPPLTSRIGAGIADLVILAVVFVLFLVAGEVALGSGRGGSLFPSPADLVELAAPYFLVLFAVCFGYFTLFHFLIGQTIGKMLFRIRVVGEERGGLIFSQAFLRSVGGLLSLLPAGLGYLRIVFDGERRGWNDRLANSRVVPVAGWEALEALNEEGLSEEG